MSRSAKHAAQATRAFAAQVIAERLKSVLRNLRKAAKASHKVSEPIHKLRVSTRRAKAAIDLFAPLLAVKQANWFRRQLRKLRKIADDARNIDVLRARLEKLPSALDKRLRRQRRAAQPPLAKREEKLDADKKWTKHARELVAPLKGKSPTNSGQPPSATDYVRQALGPIVARFTTALAIRKPSPAQLHRLRLAGKELRYALELSLPVLNAPMGHVVLQSLARLQDELGAINDHATALKMFAALRRNASTDNKVWLRTQAVTEVAAIALKRQQLLAAWPPIKRQHLAQMCRHFTPATATKNKPPARRKKRAKRRPRSKSGSR